MTRPEPRAGFSRATQARHMRSRPLQHGPRSNQTGCLAHRRAQAGRRMNRIQILLFNSLIGCAVTVQPVIVQSAFAQSPDQSRTAGAHVFGKWCGDCHSTAGGPGSLALQRKYNGSLPAILEQRVDLAPEYVRQVVRHGISFMPSFRKTEISDAELALLAVSLTPAIGRKHHAPRLNAPSLATGQSGGN